MYGSTDGGGCHFPLPRPLSFDVTGFFSGPFFFFLPKQDLKRLMFDAQVRSICWRLVFVGVRALG
jgi:hypothetical protein